MLRRVLVIVFHIASFAGFAACNYALASWCTTRRATETAPTCLGEAGARRHIVYLHGLDSFAPSWQELDNRRALAALPDVAIAIPRAPVCGAGRCWSDEDAGAAETISAIRGAAHVCFPDASSYGVVGFSRGGYALARIATCKAFGGEWAIVASAFGYTQDERLRDCPVAVMIGRDDRYQHDGAVGYAHRRQAGELPTLLIEFEGGHRLDSRSLTAAIDALEHDARQR